MPATEAPMPADGSLSLSPTTMAAETQLVQTELAQLKQAMADMVAAIPTDADSQLLRQEFGALQQQLQAVDDLEMANQILDEGFVAIKEKIIVAPNADDLIDTLYQMRESQFEQMQAFGPLLSGKQSGWLS